MKILITGSGGFIGKNFIANIGQEKDIEVFTFDAYDSMDKLAEYASVADMVFHLAGVNRPENIQEFATGNIDLTATLCTMLKNTGKPVPLIFSSSTQANVGNDYGMSKKTAENMVFDYSASTGAPVCVYRFPGVFGKWCRPNYNSVVATFCYNIARGLPINIDDSAKELTLVYIDDVVEEFRKVVFGKKAVTNNNIMPIAPIHKITLGELVAAITSFKDSRHSLTHDYERINPFMQKLYATYLSYLPEDDFSIMADMKTDARGYFAELIKAPCFGQISISCTKPGIKRGDHWHNTKVEKFIVISGQALIRFRRIDSKNVIEYKVSGEKLEIIDIPVGYTHAIVNIGQQDLLTIFWAGELFEPNNPDTNILEV